VRALAAACSGRPEVAIRLAKQALRTTRLTEVRVLAACASAVGSIMRGAANASKLCDQAFTAVRETGHIDPFVCAYRGCPSFLQELYGRKPWQSDIADIVCNAEDWGLARRLKLNPALPSRKSSEALSRREREVLALVGQGLSNKRIAQSLFITEGTVKVHVRHIFEKLGVNSRTEAAIYAARELSD
jgi:ATP/maltotriose-dependent transcriptional regulator MalT